MQAPRLDYFHISRTVHGNVEFLKWVNQCCNGSPLLAFRPGIRGAQLLTREQAIDKLDAYSHDLECIVSLHPILD